MREEKRRFVLGWLLSQKKVSRVAVQEQHYVDGNAHEEWRNIRGYEGRYQVSNLGRIKSLERIRTGKKGCNVPVPEKIMKLTTKKDNGRTKPYVEIRFRNGGLRTERSKVFLVHRLVADAFIKPLEKGDQVDHINGIHGDNRAENLRVLKTVEHARLHPIVLNPLERNPVTGQFMSIHESKNAERAKASMKRWGC